MSTALVSGFYDFSDVLCKQSHGGSHFLVDRKALARRTLSAITTPSNSNSGSNVPAKSAALLHKLSSSSLLQSSQHLPQSASIVSPQSPNIMTPQAQQGREHRKLDRSMSEPVQPQQPACRSPNGLSSNQGLSSASIAAGQAAINAAAAANQGNSSRYKTELCRPFEENGTCKYGDKCQFAHGQHELRTLARHPKYKTELCRTFHTTGFCPYGPRCHFIHNNEETKKTMITHLHPRGQSSGQNGGGLATRSNSIGGDMVRNQGNNSGNHMEVGSRHPLARPKALSIGSFSLGSTGDLSPPSSSSASPTSLNGFFGEDSFFRNNQNHRNGLQHHHHLQTPSTPNTAFSFSQDFAALVTPKTPTAVSAFGAQFRPHLPIFGGSQPSLVPQNSPAVFVGSPTSASSDFLSDSVSRDPLFKFPEAPPSPADSLGSELDSLSLGGGSPEPGHHNRLQSSPSHDGSLLGPRLPIFSRLANSDSE